MKKNPLSLLLLLLSVLAFASCKKTETDYNVGPKLQIVFDDNIDKVTADYQRASILNLKVSVGGSANSVRITSTYSVLERINNADVTRPRTLDLGVFPVNAGVVMFTIPVTGLRAVADGTLVGAGATPAGLNPVLYSRAFNSYTLLVDASAPDGSADRRFYTVVATQM